MLSCFTCEGGSVQFLLSFTVGVGQVVRVLTASINVPPSRLLRGVTRPPFVPSVAVGVGRCRAATAHPSLFGFARPSPLHVSVTSFPAFDAFGVGHNPASFTAVGRSNVRSSDNTPSRIEPHFGKVSEHADKSSSHKER
jgi:hypothetical protein